MDPKELKDSIDAGFKALDEKQTAQQEDLQAKLDEQKGIIDAQGELLEKSQNWIKEVETKANAARTHGPGDQLKNSIPERYRKHIEIAERHGFKDPVDTAAKCLWWHLKFMEKQSMMGMAAGVPGDYRKMADDLERGWGYDPLHKDDIARTWKGAQGEVVGGGGNVIATPVEAELRRLIRDNTVVRPLATRIVMSSLTHQIPTENANVTAYIVAEAGTITDSFVTTGFSQIALTAKKFAGLATVSNELLEDNIIGLNEYIFTAIAEHIGILEDRGALDGTSFTGVSVATGVNSLTINGTGVSGGSIPTYAEYTKAPYMALHSSSRMSARWFMLPFAWQQVMGLVTTDGVPVAAVGRVPEGIPETLFGYPVSIVPHLTTANTIFTSSSSIYFGPPNKILFGDLSGMSFDLDPYSMLDTVQTRIRVLRRTGIVVPVGAYFSILRGVNYD